MIRSLSETPIRMWSICWVWLGFLAVAGCGPDTQMPVISATQNVNQYDVVIVNDRWGIGFH